MNDMVSAKFENVKRINSLSLTALRQELNEVYWYFCNALQETSKENLRDVIVYKKVLLKTMKQSNDIEKAFQLGVHYEKINELIRRYRERERDMECRDVVSGVFSRRIFNFLYEHGVCDRDTLAEGLDFQIDDHVQKLIDVGLVYVFETEECDYYSLTAEGYTYKRTVESAGHL